MVGAVEVEPSEDSFVENLAGVVGGCVVEVAWSVEKFQGGEEYGAARLEVVGGALELLGDALFAFPHFLHSFFDFVLWPFGVADEVEESVFLAVEFCELRTQGGAKLGRRCLRVVCCGYGKVFERLTVLLRDADFAVVVGDGVFDFVEGQCW